MDFQGQIMILGKREKLIANLSVDIKIPTLNLN